MKTNTTLVINSKGGSGKTTLATNLASYFAVNRLATAVMDFDPQGSTLNWLRMRAHNAPRIHGANAAPQKTGLRSIGMHVPACCCRKWWRGRIPSWSRCSPPR
jgi:chromosome partitioning protein